MLKFGLALPLRSLLVPSVSHNCRWDPCIPLIVFGQNVAYTSTPHPSSKDFVLVDYLTDFLKFPKRKAIAVSTCFSYINSCEKPKAVVHDTQIQSSVQVQPTILFLDVEKNLKPKVVFFQELGLCGPHLRTMISKNPSILRCSLDKKLKPSIGVIKEALELDRSQNSNNNIIDLMFHVLSRYSWIIGKDSRLHSNITYLRSCGIVGSELIMLLKAQPRLFSIPKAQLELLVSRATQMGFVIGSGMLRYGISALLCSSAKTISLKFELLQSLGFSRDECNEVFVWSPMLLQALTEPGILSRGAQLTLI